MNGEDLLTDNFCAAVDKKLISKHILLLKSILILTAIYTATESILWYRIVKKTLSFNHLTMVELYQYRITPAVLIILFLASLVSWSIYLNGAVLLRISFNKNDADIFNSGYNNIYRASVISAIAFAVSCLHGILFLALS